MTKTNYETFKGYAISAGGVAGAVAATYFTTIYLPARIIKTTTVATTAAMNASLGSTIASWIPGTINDTAVVAGAEAYAAAKSTGFVGVSKTAMLGSTGVGYTLGSKAVEYSFTGMEKVYEVMSGTKSKVSSWVQKLETTDSSATISTGSAPAA